MTCINKVLSNYFELDKVVDETIESSGLSARLVSKTARCIKRFGLGVAAGAGVITPITMGIVFLGITSGLIPKAGFFVHSPSPTVSMSERIYVAKFLCRHSAIEEILFRCVIQDVILKRIPKYVIKKIAPKKETTLDSFVAKVAQIGLAASLFSAAHLLGPIPRGKLVYTFCLGVGCGLLKESKAGLLGSIAAHITNNLIVFFPAFCGL